MQINRNACVGCGHCMVYCPMGAIKVGERTAEIDRDACVECGVCLRAGGCPVNAFQKEALTWPRSIRATFSDPLNIHVETNMAGRGTSEMKTNDVTGRFKRGEVGIALELGRPGMGTYMTEIEKITRLLCQNGIVLEPCNPLTKLIDQTCGDISPEIRQERVMSAVVEFSVEESAIVSTLEKIKQCAATLTTVMSVGLAFRSNENGEFTHVTSQLDKAGIAYRCNGKLNIGVGRPRHPDGD